VFPATGLRSNGHVARRRPTQIEGKAELQFLPLHKSRIQLWRDMVPVKVDFERMTFHSKEAVGVAKAHDRSQPL